MDPLLPICDAHDARACPLCRPADRLTVAEGELYLDTRTGHTFHIHTLNGDGTADGAGFAPQLRLRFFRRDLATFATLVPLGAGSCPDCDN